MPFVEVDYPRGGKPITRTLKEEKVSAGKDVDEDSIEAQVVPGWESLPKQIKKYKYVSVWTKSVTADLLTEGVQGYGIVKEIQNNAVILSTANGADVLLPANKVNDIFHKRFQSKEIKMHDAFKVGDKLAFRVVWKAKDAIGKKKGSLPTVTCNPSHVNKMLQQGDIHNGLVLVAAVESVEEKGVLCQLGISGYTGFLPISETAKFVVGQPIVVRIHSVDPRIIKLRPNDQSVNLSEEACEKLELSFLMPGTVLKGEPKELTQNGTYLDLGNGVYGFLQKDQLPAHLRDRPDEVFMTQRVVVLFCQRNSNMLFLSAHPDYLKPPPPPNHDQKKKKEKKIEQKPSAETDTPKTKKRKQDDELQLKSKKRKTADSDEGDSGSEDDLASSDEDVDDEEDLFGDNDDEPVDDESDVELGETDDEEQDSDASEDPAEDVDEDDSDEEGWELASDQDAV